MSESAITGGPRQQVSDDVQVIHHLAVCLDRSPIGGRIMRHAVAMAGVLRARLTVLHALEPPHHGTMATPTDPFDWQVQRTEAEGHLDTVRSEHTTVDLSIGAEVQSIGTEVLEGRPAEQIRDGVTNHGVDLTVLASHGASGPTQWKLASTARKLIEGTPGSVLLIPARTDPEPPERDVAYDHVLVLLDGSTRAESALPLASQIVARTEDSELILLHVVPRPELPCPCPLDDDEHDLDQRLVDRNVRAAKAYLVDVDRHVARDGVRVRTHVSTDGDVRGEILRYIAENHVDLVVFSGHGQSGRAQLPVGSVASFLLEHATVPLLVVRDPTEDVPRTRPEDRSHSGLRLPQATEP
jgi:nucleotide-binding universal stress UspA family protein